MEISSEKAAVQNAQPIPAAQPVLLAESPPGITYGVVSDSEPSSLALLAAGVAGIAARRARRKELLRCLATRKTEG
jgi:MYXO-CTERM domain-containing protein